MVCRQGGADHNEIGVDASFQRTSMVAASAANIHNMQTCTAYSWFQSGLRVWVTTRVLTLLSASRASRYLNKEFVQPLTFQLHCVYALTLEAARHAGCLPWT